MPRAEFEGRTAAEAAIKACDEWGVSRSQVKFEVVSDTGEGLERLVRIVAEVDESAAGEARERPPRAESSDRDRDRDRGGRGERGGRDRDRGGRGRGDRDRGRGRRGGGRDRDDEGGRRRGRRGGRGRGRGPDEGRRFGGEQGDGIEALLDLEAIPAERPPERPVVEGEGSPKAQRGREALSEILRRGGFDLQPYLVQDEAEEIHFDLRGSDEARIIGKKGDALLALQFLLNRIVSHDNESEEESVLVLDAAGYRSRRRDALAALARKLAQRAIEEGKAVRLSPMSAHDRRVFHLTLKEMDEVDTRSEGDGLYRNLLIIPADYA